MPSKTEIDNAVSDLGESLHVYWRKYTDHNRSAEMWNLINDLDQEEWENYVEFIKSYLHQRLKDI